MNSTDKGDFPIRHMLPSAILSAADDPGKPTRALLEFSLEAIRAALEIDLSDLSARMAGPPYFPDIWPGEHYKLLAALVDVVNPRVVVEIGTATGLSALALKKFLDPASRIVTFDLVPWQDYPNHILRLSDFVDGQLSQVVDDLAELSVAHRHAHILKEADLIFVDAAKDGKMEEVLLDNFSTLGLREGACLVFDDIRKIEMIMIWRQIALPKLDVTSFGHWSGTGLVQWSAMKRWSCLQTGAT